MITQLEIPFTPAWQTELARLYAEGTEHTMGRVIGVILRLNLHPDPAQCTATFVGLRWKNPGIIGHRNVIRDQWDHSIIGRAEHPSFPVCPSHAPRHYSLLGSGLWNTQKVPLPPDFSILPLKPRKTKCSTKAGNSIPQGVMVPKRSKRP